MLNDTQQSQVRGYNWSDFYDHEWNDHQELEPIGRFQVEIGYFVGTVVHHNETELTDAELIDYCEENFLDDEPGR